LYRLLETRALETCEYEGEEEGVDGCADGLVECEFYDRVWHREFGFEDLVGFLLAVELLFVRGGGGADGRGGRDEVC
jgi:hypothetical protein